MTIADYPEIELAYRRHDALEMSYRRQAFMDRAQGRNSTANETARDEHHRAAHCLSSEVIVPELAIDTETRHLREQDDPEGAWPE